MGYAGVRDDMRFRASMSPSGGCVHARTYVCWGCLAPVSSYVRSFTPPPLCAMPERALQ